MTEYLLAGIFGFALFHSVKGVGFLFGIREDINAALVGYVFFGAYLGLLHFFIPLSIYTSMPYFVLGLSVWYLKGRRGDMDGTYNKSKYVELWIAAASIIFFADYISFSPYDKELYWDHTINWFVQEPIIYGLANLHGRLGFNNANLVYIAGLSLPNSINVGWLAFNLFFVFIFLRIFCKALFLPSGKNDIWMWIFIIPFLFYVKTNTIGSANFVFFVFGLLLFLLFKATLGGHLRGRDSAEWGMTIIFVSGAIVFNKLSGAAYAIFFACYGVILLSKGIFYKRKLTNFHPYLLLTGLSIASVLHFYRSVILSGYPFFPSSALNYFDVDWKVPLSLLNQEKNAIIGWARSPGSDYLKSLGNDFSWVMEWLDRGISISALLLLLFSLASIAYLLVLYCKNRISTSWGFLGLGLLVSHLFWFFTAPAFVFLGAVPFISIYLGASLLFGNWESKLIISRRNFVLMFVSLSLAVLASSFYLKREFDCSVDDRCESFTKKTTDYGIDIFIPIDDDRCGKNYLFCSPIFRKELYFNDRKFQLY